ncbi:MAG: pseudouridine synthase [Acidobacteriaceae bacterium]
MIANDPEHEASPQRLQKIIAAAGIASRRKAEELITAGRVQVNGQTVTELGAKADPARDHIRVDGKLLHGPERPRYYVLNKPKGYVTTASDPEHRPTVTDFFKGGERVFPVGRLDYSSEGLLLMTNDGELANALTRAAARVEKTYLVKVSGKPSDSAINQLRHGVMIDVGTQIRKPGSTPARRNEGRVMTAPARIRLLRDADNPWYEMILIEGRNREIRKMFEEIGHHVEKIRRVGYGPLVLDVEPGRHRELTLEEVAHLRRAAEGKSPRPAPEADSRKRRRSAPRPSRPANSSLSPGARNKRRQRRPSVP